MRFAVTIACVLAVASAEFIQGQYFSQNNNYKKEYGFRGFQSTSKPFVSSTAFPVRPSVVPPRPTPGPAPIVPIAKVAADARSAETLRYGNEAEADGTYNYFYETNNGIAAQAQGAPRTFSGNPPVAPSVAQGSFSWTSPEGEVIAIRYIADENGYQPEGSAIPQPPEVPYQIARALAYAAKYTPPVRTYSAVLRK